MISVTSWQSNYEYEVEYEIILASSRLICSSNHQGDFSFHLKASSLFFSRGSVYFLHFWPIFRYLENHPFWKSQFYHSYDLSICYQVFRSRGSSVQTFASLFLHLIHWLRRRPNKLIYLWSLRPSTMSTVLLSRINIGHLCLFNYKLQADYVANNIYFCM